MTTSLECVFSQLHPPEICVVIYKPASLSASNVSVMLVMHHTVTMEWISKCVYSYPRHTKYVCHQNFKCCAVDSGRGSVWYRKILFALSGIETTSSSRAVESVFSCTIRNFYVLWSQSNYQLLLLFFKESSTMFREQDRFLKSG